MDRAKQSEHVPAETSPVRKLQMWKLTLSYDGSDFFGWQVQPGLRTVQGELQRVLREVLGENVMPQGSGRTDSGVHADGQVVSVPLAASIPPDRLLRALNRKLPASVRLLSAELAPENFHARGNVAWKQYTFRVFQRRSPEWTGERICPPLLARSVWDCRWPLDRNNMQAAAADVLGTHDFTSFAAHDPDRSSRAEQRDRSLVRTIYSSEWFVEGNLLIYRVAGSGFLHHMVRNLVGTFVEIGAGRHPADCIGGILLAKNRAAAGPTAPPQGLSLTRVVYRDEQDANHFSAPEREPPI